MAGTEAHKIVAVSLSKIAASRATRSGINLYKSLMVSSILYKARTVVIMEKYNGPFTSREKTTTESSLESSEELQQSEENTDIPTTDIDDYDADEEVDDELDDNQTVDSQDNQVPESQDSETEDKENMCNQEDSDIKLSKSSDSNTQLSSTVLKACENTTQNLDNKEIIKCERCTKRRLTEVESAVDSILPPKKVKNEDSENSNSTSDSEPMEGVQITQLVDSFTGLLSQATCNSNILKSADQNTFSNNKSSNSTSSSKSHGLSEAFNHCSTQIKESFDTLASPIIALGITA